jgi:UbiD family decarboxylase
MIGTLAAAEIRQLYQEHSLPVKEAMAQFEMQVTWVALRIVTVKLRQMKLEPQDFRQQIGELVFNSKVGYTIHRLVLVGEHINVYNFKDVIFSFSTRCRPETDELFFQRCRGFPLVSYMSHGSISPTTSGKVVSDALLPVEYTAGRNWELADFKHSYPQSLQETVHKRWQGWGFEA